MRNQTDEKRCTDHQTDEKRCTDHFEVTEGDHPFDLHSFTAWLVGQGIRLLQSTDEQGKRSFRYVIELLSAREDAVRTIIQMAKPKRVSVNDISLRWNLLYLLGQVGDFQMLLNFLSVLQSRSYQRRDRKVVVRGLTMGKCSFERWR